MLSRTLMLTVVAVAMGTLVANGQTNSSNSTAAPIAGGATKTEAPGANAQVPGPAKRPDTAESSSSNTTMAPTTTGGIAKTEAPGANAQVPGAAKQPDSSQSSSPTTGASK